MKKLILSLYALLSPGLAFAQEGTKNLQVVTAEQIDTAKKLVQIITEFFVKYSFQVLGGIIVLVIGWLVAKYIASLVNKLLMKKNVDVTVTKFIVGAVKLLIMVFVIIVALGNFGIEIAPLIAAVSVAGFGLSFALQGPLSNYASGATLIFTKPFKVGDIIEVAGIEGEVVDMKLPRTEVKTLDGDLVFVPNKHIIGEVIHNYSYLKRVNITVGVSYSADTDKAIKIVKSVVEGQEKVSKEKTPKVGITEFADSSVNIYARLWCRQDDYLDVIFAVNDGIFREFNKQGIEIPFPQRDVHLIKEG